MNEDKDNKQGNNSVVTKQTTLFKQEVEMFYNGPIPLASEFEKYEKVLPGSADRILKMAENQSGHRRFIEKVFSFGLVFQSMFGQISALVIVLSGMGSGVFLIIKDKPIQGFVSILIPLSVVASAMLIQKKIDKDKKGQVKSKEN
jgi:uncharacterized membrane protein